MIKALNKIWPNWLHLGAAVSLTACFHSPWAISQVKQDLPASLPSSMLGQRASFSYKAYILGPGDGLEIELVDLPELSGRFAIGPDGTLYLPRLRALYVEGMTVYELQKYLTEQFRTYVIDPKVYVRPVVYRSIRVYVGGEVKRPGYYTLSEPVGLLDPSLNQNQSLLRKSPEQNPENKPLNLNKSNHKVFPTIFDAVQTAQGITPYSNLAKVEVTRRQPLSRGGGRIRTELNFLSLITEGDESQNIRLLDGDVVNVAKSPTVLRDQLIQAGQTNLTPEFMEVYVTGRVQQSGAVTLPQGSSLIHALDLAGGTKVMHGKVEFIRFNHAGEMDRRIFRLDNDVPSGDFRNPVLMAGDVIRIRETAFTKSAAIIGELTQPFTGVYSLFSLFDNFGDL